MKILVVGANGKAGRLIVEEALRRGHTAAAAVRGENRTQAQTAIVKDAMALEKSDLEGFDVIVDALGFWTPETLPQHSASAEHLCGLLAGSARKIFFVAGAGSLYMDAAHTKQLADEPSFPAEYFPLADEMRRQLSLIRSHKDVRWTYVSPAAVFLPDAPRTGRYVIGGSEFSVNEAGESQVSYADYAAAMLDLIEQGGHEQEHVSVRS